MTTSSALIGVDTKVDDALKHYGVKGMKWGVRKDKDKDKPKSKSKTTIDKTKPNTKIKEEEPAASGGGGGANTEEDDLRELEAINGVLESGGDMSLKEFTTLLRRKSEIQKRMDARNKPDDEKSSSRKEPKKPKATDKITSEGVSIDKVFNLNSDLTTEERIARGRKRRLEREKRNGSAKHSDLLSVKMKDSASGNHLAHHQAVIDLDNHLMHYGVKGMRWGVRRDLKKKGSSSERAEYIAEKDAKWRSSVSNPKKAVRVAKKASREATKMTKELNAKYKKQGYKIGGNSLRKNSLDNRRNKLARVQYDTELKGILEYSLDKAALKVYKNSPTRLYQVNLSRNSDGTVSAKIAPRQNAKLDKQLASITKRSNKIQHSDEDDGMEDLSGLEFKLTQDSDGFVTSVEVPGDDLGHDDLDDLDDYLMHYGVKGMRWGVRKDGKPQGHQGGSSKSKSKSASDKLKARASKLSSSAKKKIRKATDPKERAKRIIRKQKRKADIAEAKAEANARIAEAEKKAAAARKPTETTRTAMTAKSGSGSMSDKELKAVVERMNLEKQYAKHMSDAKPKPMSKQLLNFAKDTAIDFGKQRLKAEINRNLGNNFDKLFKVAGATASKGDPTPEPEAKNPFTFKARTPKAPKAPKPKDPPSSATRTQSPPTRPNPPSYGPTRPALMSPPNPSILALPAPKPKGPSSGPSTSTRMKDNPTVAKFGKVSMDQVQAYKEGRPYKPFDPRRRR